MVFNLEWEDKLSQLLCYIGKIADSFSTIQLKNTTRRCYGVLL